MAAKTISRNAARKARFAASKKKREKCAEIAAMAQKYLDRHQPSGYRIVVPKNGVELRGHTWLVVVQPDRSDAPTYDYVNRMTEASMELERNEKIDVFLVPGFPPEDD